MRPDRPTLRPQLSAGSGAPPRRCRFGLGGELSEQPFPGADFPLRRKQWPQSRGGTTQLLPEWPIGFEAPQQASERLCVTNPEIAWVVRTEQPNIAVDARGQNGHTGHDSFGNDVGTTLTERGHNHRV